MTKTSTKIVYFGSGPVAALSLDRLSKFVTVEAVVTKPKPAHHRGNFPVIDVAKELNLPVYTVSDKSELSNLISTRPFSSKIGVLVDFGIIVTKDVIEYFPLGIINSHFSLLPEWRGADPITFSILSGQPKTGVSLMLIDEGMDTGKLIAQRSLQINQSATSQTLTEKLIELSGDMLVSYLPKYITGEIKPLAQPHKECATYSKKLVKFDGIIDLSKPAIQLEREIRAYIGWPKSTTVIAGKQVIITSAHVSKSSENNELALKTSDGYLTIDSLKPANGKDMLASAFIVGHKHLL